jgi:hypothetical protein
MDYELKLVLTQDTAAMRQFYPDDMAVTNPFNQFIDKRKVMERVKADMVFPRKSGGREKSSFINLNYFPHVKQEDVQQGV